MGSVDYGAESILLLVVLAACPQVMCCCHGKVQDVAGELNSGTQSVCTFHSVFLAYEYRLRVSYKRV